MIQSPVTRLDAWPRMISSCTRREVEAGWGPAYVERVHKKGKLTARERLAKLADPGTRVFETGTLGRRWVGSLDDLDVAAHVEGILGGRERAGGGETYAARHRARGKLLARERVELLLDRDAPFLELSPLAAWGTE